MGFRPKRHDAFGMKGSCGCALHGWKGHEELPWYVNAMTVEPIGKWAQTDEVETTLDQIAYDQGMKTSRADISWEMAEALWGERVYGK